MFGSVLLSAFIFWILRRKRMLWQWTVISEQ
jgi:hypothetical protein